MEVGELCSGLVLSKCRQLWPGTYILQLEQWPLHGDVVEWPPHADVAGAEDVKAWLLLSNCGHHHSCYRSID